MKTIRIEQWLVLTLCCVLTRMNFAVEALKPEPLAGSSAPEIVFLDKAAGAAAFIEDKDEPYFDTLQPIEMAAKTLAPITGETLADQRAECRRRYHDAVLEFSDDEKALLKGCIEKFYAAVSADYPLYVKVPWSFIKVDDSVEGAFPHTRGTHVILSQRELARYQKMKAKLDDAQAQTRIGLVLLHEQFHVFQRKYPELIATLYTGVWGFKHVDAIAGCDWLTAHHLANPDGLDCRWIFPIKIDDAVRFILPLVVFDSADKPQVMGRDFRMIALELEEDKGWRVKLGDQNVPVYSELMKVPEYREKFGIFGEIFHPNEISAVAFSLAVMEEALKPKGEAGQKQFEELEKQLAPARAWMKENLREKK